MPDRLDRTLDRDWVALVLAPFAGLITFLVMAVVLENPFSPREWPAQVIDAFGGAIVFGWFLLPLPFVVIYGFELALHMRRRSLLDLPWLQLLVLGTSVGSACMFLISRTAFPIDLGRALALGGTAGLGAAATMLALRLPRGAS